MFYNRLTAHFNISPLVSGFARKAEENLSDVFAAARKTSEICQLKILSAMQKNKLSDTHFAGTTGYGYNDAGRDAAEEIFADIFKAEAALVRPQLVSGTHALAAALFGNLRPGDELVSAVGKPYDTLESVIGIRPALGSLAEFGVTYKQADLTPEGDMDYAAVKSAISAKTKMVTLQRSKGYAWRKSFTVEELERMIGAIRELAPRAIILVDNCYGEFVETREPVEAGADLIAGSLIKNPGGGLAAGGGYVAGKEEYVEAAATRLTSPGLGKEVGPTLGMTRQILQGLFIAPQVVAGCINGAALAAEVFESCGFEVLPKARDARADIVQAVRLGSREAVLAFCRGIQKAAPVDSFVTPVAAPMPGYDSEVVMAAGAFVQGSSIELSADAPLKPPYIVYFQGGITEAHSKAGAVFALNELLDAGLVKLG